MISTTERWRYASCLVLAVIFQGIASIPATSSIDTVACGGKVTAVSGDRFFMTPGWPKGQIYSSTCRWEISPPVGFAVEIQFLDINIDMCCDYIYVSHLSNDATISTIRSPTTEIFRSNLDDGIVVLLYAPGFTRAKRGIQFVYRAVDPRPPTPTPTPSPTPPPSVCGGDLVVGRELSFISTPGWPKEFDPNILMCQWILYPPRGYSIELKFKDVDMDLCCDYIDVVFRHSDVVVPRITSTTTETYKGSPSSSVELMFWGPGFTTKKRGFQASVIATCNYKLTVTDETKYFSSPNFEVEYQANSDCTWELEAEEGKKIELYIEEFETEQCCDSVTILGSAKNLELRGSHSGLTVRSFARLLNIRLKTDEKNNAKGFYASYRAVGPATIPECGADITVTSSGNIFVPGYPSSPYPSNMDCWWRLMAPDANYRIKIEVDVFASERCCDYVKIYEGEEMLAWLRGTYNYAPVYSYKSKGDSLRIHFHSDSTAEMKGFNLYYVLKTKPQVMTTGCSDSSMRIPFDKRMKTNVTVGGRTCQSWGSQYPHEHTRTPDKYPSFDLSNNYCRNLYKDVGLWCYTTDPEVRWELCEVPQCEDFCSEITTNGRSYRGNVSVTKSGLSCQQWSSQVPHQHTRIPDDYPGTGLTENYCRNPGGSEGPWCFTTDPAVRWQYCDIPECTVSCSFDPPVISDRKSIFRTVSGRLCQPWASQTPHRHTWDPKLNSNLDLSGNLCRNPDRTQGLWCFTTDPDVRRESCEVSQCTDDCYDPSTNGNTFRGIMNVTKTGRLCQAWSAQSPHTHSWIPERYQGSGLEENYCRNPHNADSDSPWCYTTDPDVRWEYCDVPACPAVFTCNTSEYQCLITSVCIPLTRRCDGFADCVDGDDEEACVTKEEECEEGEFECGPGDCIDAQKECDGKRDCSNGFDENFCEVCSDNPPIIPPEIFLKLTKTVNGRECQAWSSQYPHSHTRTPSDYPQSDLRENYCRNPDGEQGIWCYTTDPEVRWEYCEVPKCGEDCLFDSPVSKTNHANVTLSGRTCQAWNSQSPHQHLTSQNDDTTNLCRYLDGKTALWCYTTDPDVRWEFCEIPKCTADCYAAKTKGSTYRGNITTTKKGNTCQAWSSQFPHKHSRTPEAYSRHGLEENYCRNPDKSDMPWCYTTDPSVRWEYCDISPCAAPPTTETPTTTDAPSTTPVVVEVCSDNPPIIPPEMFLKLTKTVNGRECQAWSSQYPHSHTRTRRNYPKSDLRGNYCRNPDGEQGIWCYTTDPDVRWEYCEVLKCGENCSFDSPESKTQNPNVTLSGRNCQAWNSQSPHQHLIMQDYDTTNLCRYLDGKTALWCFTTDPDVRWEFCEIPRCTADCYAEKTKGSTYRGNITTTKNGNTCQAWSSQFPHEHTRTPEAYSRLGLEENYCRNPDKSDMPWCYTTDPSVRWEYCDISPCAAPPTTETPTTTDAPSTTPVVVEGCSYNPPIIPPGMFLKLTKTVNGRECQAWSSQYPHSHTRTPSDYPQSDLRENYCRNPDGEQGIWCYTTDPDVRWEFCEIPKCTADCYAEKTKGSTYRGNITMTKNGNSCQAWSSQFPHEHTRTPEAYSSFGLEENYCRNPDSSDMPWCYTTDPSVRWEYCDISPCAAPPTTETPTTTDAPSTTPVVVEVCSDNPPIIPPEMFLKLTKTVNGRECQAWSSQYPHSHTRTRRNYPKSDLRGNYCRNPDGEQGIWCYTTDPDVRWEYCEVLKCGENCSFDSPESKTQDPNVTLSGRNCQAWNSQSPHQHLITQDYDTTNLCRYLEGKTALWCFTTDPDVRWEFCEIPRCTADCYAEKTKGSTYRGNITTTKNGNTCQAWSSQFPHEHTRTPEAYSRLGLEENYCRNPDKSDMPWCYTTDPSVRWEYCDISPCAAPPTTETPTTTDAPSTTPVVVEDCSYNPPIIPPEMFLKLTKTVNGRECQAWSSQYPHSHTRTHSDYPQSDLRENYCRNPDGEQGIWCYTTDPDVRWEFCEIPKCTADCYAEKTKGSTYRGNITMTKNGNSCQAWSSQFPHEHTRTPEAYSSFGLEENYCRNPDNSDMPWCYTTDPSERWEYCDISPCAAPPTTETPLTTDAPSTIPVVVVRPENCGNRMRRVYYGKVYNFLSPSKTPSRCKWRFRAKRGMLVEFTIDEIDIDPCCGSMKFYDASRYVFDWTSQYLINSLNNTAQSGYKIRSPSFMTGLLFTSNSTKTRFSMSYKAVVPSDTNCGFSTVAVRKVRRNFQTPGWPRTYPENMNCTWKISTKGKKRGAQIKLDLRNVGVTDANDFLKIYDGNTLISTFSGRSANSVTYVSTAGQFRIHFGSNSFLSGKGFRAYYKLAEPEDLTTTTAEPVTTIATATTPELTTPFTTAAMNITAAATTAIYEMNTTTDGTTAVQGKRLRCYDLMQVGIWNGAVLQSRNEEITCDEDSMCLLINVKTSGTMTGVSNEHSSQVIQGNCYPRSIEEDFTCEQVLSNLKLLSGLNITNSSCGIKFCYDDLCNDRNNLPELTTSISELNKTVSKDGIECYNIMKTVTSDGVVVINRMNKTKCAAGSNCLLSKSIYSGKHFDVTVTYGTCFPHDKCYRLCEQISPLADEMDVNVTLKNCTSFCCKEDLCNDDISAQIQTSTMSTAVSTAMVDITTAAVPKSIKCFDMKKVMVQPSGMKVINSVEAKECAAGSSCLYMQTEATATSSVVDMQLKVVYGSCQPDELCSYDECDKLQSLLADSGPIQISNLKNCKAFCCKEDLCNGENSTQVVEYTTASIVASTIQSIATTAPSVPDDTTVNDDQIQCHDRMITKILPMGTIVMDTRSTVNCSTSTSRCAFMKATTSSPSLPDNVKVDVTYAQCIPISQCIMDGCGQLSQIDSSLIQGMSFDDCVSYCCDTNLCNGSPRSSADTTTAGSVTESTASAIIPDSTTPRPVPVNTMASYNVTSEITRSVTTAAMSIFQSLSTPSSKLDGTTVNDDQIQCHEIMITKILPMGTMLTNKQSTVNCSTLTSRCGFIKATTSSSSLPVDVKVDVTYAQCIPISQCIMGGCGQLSQIDSSLTQGMSFDDCVSYCCDTNLCNSSPRSSVDTTTAGSVTESTASAFTSPLLTTPRPVTTNASYNMTSEVTRSVTTAAMSISIERILSVSSAKLVVKTTLPPADKSANKCYRYAYVKVSDSVVIDVQRTDDCGENSVCKSIAVNATSDTANVILKFGSCYESSSEATCTEIIDRRDDLAAFPNAVIESCVMADCVEDFCNVHDDLLKSATEAATTAAGRFARLGTLSWITPEMPTTTPVLTTAATDKELRCYSVLYSEALGIVVLNNQRVMTCKENSVCMLLSVNSSVTINSAESIGGFIVYGMCYPESLRASTSCEQVFENVDSASMSKTMGDVKIKNCRLSFCEDDLCNDPNGSSLPVHVPTEKRPSVGKAIQCARLMMIEPQMSVNSNFNSHMTCPIGSSCFLYKASVTMEAAFFQRTFNMTSGGCTLSELCEYSNCDQLKNLLPSEVAGITMEIDDCEASCCTDDLCNDVAISEPEIPSITTDEPDISEPLKCYESLMTNGIGNNQEKICSPQSKCVLVKASVTTQALPDTEATTYYGDCMPDTSCEFFDCKMLDNVFRHLYDEAMTITSCDISCCDSDLCNLVPEALSTMTPSLPQTTGSPGLVCYDTLQTAGFGKKVEKICPPMSKCVLIEAKALMPSVAGSAVTTTFGGCASGVSCDFMSCDLMETVIQSTFGDSIVMSSCDISCCDTNLCNSAIKPVTPPESTPTSLPTAIRCYDSLTTSGVGKKLIKECPPNYSCVLAITEATLRDIGMNVTSVFGSCVPSVGCPALTCDAVIGNLQGVESLSITSCDINCCNTDLCNDDSLYSNESVAVTMTPLFPAGEITAPPEKEMQCYKTTISSQNGHEPVGLKEIKTCPPMSSCLVAGTIATDGNNFQIATLYGDCIPTAICASINCDNLRTVLSSASGNVTVRACDVTCCETDLCNTEDLLTPVAVSGPHKKDSSEVFHCHQSLITTGFGMTSGTQGIKLCPAGSSCVYAKATATVEGGRDGIVTTIFGDCMPSATCRAINCDSLSSVLMSAADGMTILSCETSCCDTDLCNAGDALSVNITLPPTKLLPSSNDTSSGQASTLLQCYYSLYLNSTSEGMIPHVDKQIAMTCKENAVCLLLRLRSVADDGDTKSENEVMFGSCFNGDYRDSANCEQMLPNLDSLGNNNRNTNITDCQLSFCKDDFCNDHSATSSLSIHQPLPTLNESVITCYSYREMTTSSGSVNVVIAESVVTCPAGSSCLYTTASLKSSVINIQGSIVSGSCIATGICDYQANCMQTKELLPRSIMQYVDESSFSCSSTCCDTDLCNKEKRPSRPVPTLECYNQRSRIGPETGSAGHDSMKCSLGYSCVFAKALASKEGYPENSVTITYGGCISSPLCSSMTCDSLPSDFESLFEDGDAISTCAAVCCDSALCNDEAILKDMLPIPTPTQSRTPPPDIMDGSSSEEFSCYKLSAVFGLGDENTSVKGEKLCPLGSRCILVMAVFKSGADPDSEYKAMYGDCIPSSLCSDDSDVCKSMPYLMNMTGSEIELTSCRSSCCESSLCNDVTSVPTVIDKPGPPPVEIQCHNPLVLSGWNRTILSTPGFSVCGSDQTCLQLNAKVQSLGFSNEAFTIGVSKCVPKSTCDPSDSCFRMLSSLQTGKILVPGGFGEVKECTANCCSSPECRIGRPSPVTPTMLPLSETTMEMQYSEYDIVLDDILIEIKMFQHDDAFFAHCSMQDYLTRSWTCATLILNSIMNQTNCDDKIRKMKMCQINVDSQCRGESTNINPYSLDGDNHRELQNIMLYAKDLVELSWMQKTLCDSNALSDIREYPDYHEQLLNWCGSEAKERIRQLDVDALVLQYLLSIKNSVQFCNLYSKYKNDIIKTIMSDECEMTSLSSDLKSTLRLSMKVFTDAVENLHLPCCYAVQSSGTQKVDDNGVFNVLFESKNYDHDVESNLETEENKVTEPPTECTRKYLDLMFLLDSAQPRTSEFGAYFSQMQNFVYDVVSRLEFDENTYIGLAVYAKWRSSVLRRRVVRADLGQFKTQEDFVGQLINLKIRGRTRAPFSALQVVASNDFKNSRPCSEKMIVLVVSGSISDVPNANKTRDLLNNEGITLYTVALPISGDSQEQLELLTSGLDKHQEHFTTSFPSAVEPLLQYILNRFPEAEIQPIQISSGP